MTKYKCCKCAKKVRFWSAKTYVTANGEIICEECKDQNGG